MALFENWLNRRKGNATSDLFKLDPKKTPEENIILIVQGICAKKPSNEVSPTSKNPPQEGRSFSMARVGHSILDKHKISYLNAMVTLICKEDKSQWGFSTEELMICLRKSLVDDSIAVRAAALRVLRYLIKTENDVNVFNVLKLPYLVTRSIDLMTRNEEERAQALRVVRRVIAVVGPSLQRQGIMLIDPSLLKCLVAVARSNASDGSGDRLARPAIATLAEIGVMSPRSIWRVGGVLTVLRPLREVPTPRMAEALVGSLLQALQPLRSSDAAQRLAPLAAPFCDFTGGSESARDERELRLSCSSLALLSVLRTWPGALLFCSPYEEAGLSALVKALALPRLEVRKAILDLFYELLGLPQPEWTDELSVAMAAIDPSDFQDSWRLNEGFVVAEGLAILPHLRENGPDITEAHTALLLQCFMEAGLPDALAQVIISSDTFISVRATVLLSRVLSLCCTRLPNSQAQSLPCLISSATGLSPPALAALRAFVPCSTPLHLSAYLMHVLQCASSMKTCTAVDQALERDDSQLFRCSQVMQNKDGNTWHWEIIRTILKETDDRPFLNLNDSAHKAWAARIINYLKPSSNKYSHNDLILNFHGNSSTKASCQLIRHLLKHDDPESTSILLTLFEDISRQVQAIETGRKAHECLFSPQHMSNTMCQMYFLFIGQLCHCESGLALFKKTGLYEHLLELTTKTHHSCYVKLVIPSLNYSLDSYPRTILARTLTCPNQVSRLYCTQFLNVLLRAVHRSKQVVRPKLRKKYQVHTQSNDDMISWVLSMLVGQLKDESKDVVKCAVGILEEACCVPSYMEKLIELKDKIGECLKMSIDTEPESIDMSVAGDRGYLLWLSLQVNSMKNSTDNRTVEFLNNHLNYWSRFYCYRYVRVVESSIHSCLTLCGGPRSSADIPQHLYAAITCRADDMGDTVIAMDYKVLKAGNCSNEQETMDLKSALWSLGNIAIKPNGLQKLLSLSSNSDESVPVLVLNLVKHCPLYSIRAIAFYVLGMIGSTLLGANLLGELGWRCVRHNRHESFPVIDEEIDNVESQYTITSPKRYLNKIDIEGDQSDRSTAESINSVQAKGFSKMLSQSNVEPQLKPPDDQNRSQKKSHTLPNRGYGQSHKFISESRTVDMLRDYSGRVRLASESSTSGVSSCDSAMGRHPPLDRVLTLSPIPSSSSLYGSNPHKTKMQLQRKTSASSFSTADSVTSPMSQKDMCGYETLKSLNTKRRPNVSESSSNGQADLEELSWILNESSRRRSKTFSSLRDKGKAIKERISKLSITERNWKQPEVEVQPLQLRVRERKKKRIMRRTQDENYIGICLPNNLRDLYQKADLEYVYTDDQDDTSMLLETNTTVDSKMRTSLASSVNSTKGNEWSTANNAQAHVPSSCLVCLVRPVSAQQLRQAFFADMESANQAIDSLHSSKNPSPENEYTVQQTEILHHVKYLANPIHYRQSRPTLITLKQRYPSLFSSACLYSDACALLSTGTYMQCARRFVQELFNDVHFDAFHLAPLHILARKRPTIPLSE